MKNNKIWFKILLLVIPILFGFSAGFVDNFFVEADLSGLMTRWEKLPAPPSKVLYLVGINNADLYVTTLQDEILTANLNTCFESDKNCWQAVVPSEPIKPPSFTLCWYEFKVANPPPNAVQRIDNCEGGSGGVLRTNAVLLFDGSILIWRDVYYDLSPFAFMTVPVYAFFGLIIGAIVSMIVAILHKRKVEHSQDEEE
jgi:hypothetical protein